MGRQMEWASSCERRSWRERRRAAGRPPRGALERRTRSQRRGEARTPNEMAQDRRQRQIAERAWKQEGRLGVPRGAYWDTQPPAGPGERRPPLPTPR